jgi:hypothetical protein
LKQHHFGLDNINLRNSAKSFSLACCGIDVVDARMRHNAEGPWTPIPHTASDPNMGTVQGGTVMKKGARFPPNSGTDYLMLPTGAHVWGVRTRGGNHTVVVPGGGNPPVFPRYVPNPARPQRPDRDFRQGSMGRDATTRGLRTRSPRRPNSGIGAGGPQY